MVKFLCLLASAALGVAAVGVSSARADVVIADQGKSNFSIIVNAKAPKSVQAAAQELQKDIELASGAKLSIIDDTGVAGGSFISLGDTGHARAAGLNTADIGDEGYRIITKSGNLYILGPDTPDGEWTQLGGTSNGTANGVYSFLEQKLNVQWLMPGDIGRDVPRMDKLTIAEMDLTHIPPFSYRDLTLTKVVQNAQAREVIDVWLARQRIGSSWNLQYNHNFWRTLAGGRLDLDSPLLKKAYEEHPDWFAMDAKGERPFPKNHYYKLETTNRGLIEFFAQKAIETLKNARRPQTFSLSPSDGRAWSLSPESKALYDPAPAMPRRANDSETPGGVPAMSSLVLKWYHDVAQIVEREYPQGRLAGLVYSDYIYPPVNYQMKLPDNFTPVICGIGEYGYGLYRQANVERYNQIMDAWAKVAPTNWFYYGLPNQVLRQNQRDVGGAGIPGGTALVMPAAPDLLNIVWDNIRRNRMKGADIYGTPTWSQTAMSNYIIAQMMWDPTRDAYAVQKEWLWRAYGPGAGAVMQQFYKELNDWYRDWYQDNDNSYYLTVTMLKDVYGVHYPRLEQLYLEAAGQPMTNVQKQRLQLIGDNLIVLQWRLRNGGLWPAGQASRLQRTDAQVIPMLTASVDGVEMFPGVIRGSRRPDYTRIVRRTQAAMKDVNVQLSHAAAPAKAVVPNMEENVIVIYAAKAGPVRIVPESVRHGAYFASYVLTDKYDRLFDEYPAVASGVLETGRPVEFTAKANTAYYLYLPPRNPVRYALRVEGAAVTTGSMNQKTLTLHAADNAAVYVYYHPQKAPIGIRQSKGSVIIQKPFSAGAAKAALEKGNQYGDLRIIDGLDTDWRFSPDSKDQLQNEGVTQTGLDDSAWAVVDALNWWQAQGFDGYYGPAWYRKHFSSDALPKGHTALFYFGAVDGHATVYLNGQQIGQHLIGENYKGWNEPFVVTAPDLKEGDNLLAVKVVSKSNDGSSGIFGGVSLLSGVSK